MEWSDSALVLGVGRFREADLWLRLLTRKRGLVSAFAFGGSRSRKRFCGCLDILNELQVRTRSTRNGQYTALQEGILLNGPRRLRTDGRRLGMLMNCVRFLEALGVTPDGGEVAFALMQDLLTLFEEEAPIQDLLPLLFRLRLASDQGYAPTFSACSQCGRSGENLVRAFFLVAEGVILCPHCVAGAENNVEISAATLDLLCRVQEDSPHGWSTEALAPGQKRECARVVDGFVQYHLGLVWDKGSFRRQ